MATWILEQNVFAEVCFDRMVAHLSARSIPYHVVKIVPFVHEISGPSPVIAPDEKVIIYGSIGIQVLARRNGWKPGVFSVCTEEETRTHLGDLYLNADLTRMMISEVASYAATKQDKFFIKPDTDTKEFAGEIMAAESFLPWYDNMRKIGYLEDHDFPVVLSSPKPLGCEWRVVVVDGKISSYSLYRQWQSVMPEHHILPEVEALVMEAHARFSPAPVYVIDVCQVGDEFKVIEYNAFNSAGLYECEVEKIIDDVTAYVETSG